MTQSYSEATRRIEEEETKKKKKKKKKEALLLPLLAISSIWLKAQCTSLMHKIFSFCIFKRGNAAP
jgi:hypothetical protein